MEVFVFQKLPYWNIFLKEELFLYYFTDFSNRTKIVFLEPIHRVECDLPKRRKKSWNHLSALSLQEKNIRAIALNIFVKEKKICDSFSKKLISMRVFAVSDKWSFVKFFCVLTGIIDLESILNNLSIKVFFLGLQPSLYHYLWRVH